MFGKPEKIRYLCKEKQQIKSCDNEESNCHIQQY